jgi:MoxR-like ATPase
MPTLIYKFQNEERRITLNDRLTIGRADDNDLRLSCDSVSSHHAVIARDGGRFQVTDAGSRYGIFADGLKVSRLDLQEGAIFTLGDVEFVFSANDEPAKDEATDPPPQAAAPEPDPDPLAQIAAFKSAHEKILAEIGKVIVGQRTALNQMLVALFARGHCLLIGVPGLAKTLMVKTLGNAVDLEARRIQFTPDLMPSDITGTDILEEDAVTGKRVFRFHRGPIFTNLLLADEINRTPPKTQAALLEAMQEHRVTISGATYDLPDPFMVLATQNPIEQEGTYPLPEAQLDRFMFCVHLGYPSAPDELQVILETTRNVKAAVAAALNAAGVLKLQHLVRQVPVSQHVAQYALNLIRATRPNADGAPDFVNRWVRWGAGTRAGQYLLLAAKAHVLLQGRFSVSCADVREHALPVLRHRIFPNFTAASESVTTDQIVKKIVETVKEPQY